MARLRAGDEGGLFVTAESQTGGKGRQGRVWTSPPGNLYASLALRLAVPSGVAPQLGFVAGVALATALGGRLGEDTRLALKWPNDVIFAGAKLAGILLESTHLSCGRIGVVIGFGVNCRSHPADLPYAATDLATCGDPAPEPRHLLAALAIELDRWLETWDRGMGFEHIRSAWMARAVPYGTRLAVALPGERLSGTFAGLDTSGRLLVDCDAGRRAVDAGDVFLPELVNSK